jgi:PGF-CTERM protein
MRQLLVSMAVIALLVTVTAGSTAAGPPAVDAPPSAHPHPSGQQHSASLSAQQAVEPCAASPQDDAPATDVIGWHDGQWYDDELSIDESDGFDDRELDALVARTAARYEALRCWEIDETPPVEIKQRSEINTTETFFGNVTTRARTFVNAQYETLLMVGPQQDAVDVQRDNLGSAVLGYYDPTADEIVLVSESGGSVEVDEFTLAQEIGHSVQDQRYDLTSYNASLHDLNIAETGLIEGDANLVQYRYEQRCQGAWEGTCYGPDENAQSDGPDLADIGPYLLSFHPYVDGPVWAESLYERGGWDAVDAAYTNPPQTTAELIEPETYPDDSPPTVTIRESPGARWSLLESDGNGPDYQIIGEAGIAAMVMSPTFETGGQGGLLGVRQVYNLDGRQIDEKQPYNYAHDFSDGWAGDRMRVYTDRDGQTATVWKIGWQTARDRQEFVDTYAELLAYRGGQRISANETVYRFAADSEFEGAVAVVTEGNTVTIVEAPSVAALSSLQGAVQASAGGQSGPVPGFGTITALVALLCAGVLLARRLPRVADFSGPDR